MQRARWEPAGLSLGAASVCAELGKPRSRGDGWPQGPSPAVCGSQPWPCLGSGDSDSGNRKKKETMWPLYCPKSPPISAGEQPGLEPTHVGQKNAFYRQFGPGFKSRSHLS